MFRAISVLLGVAWGWVLRTAQVDLQGAEVHSRRPLVLTKDGFLSAEECAEIIRVAKPKLFQAEVVGHNHDSRSAQSPNRLAMSAWVDYHKGGDNTIRNVARRAAKLMGAPNWKHFELLHVVRYDDKPAGYYKLHADGFAKEHFYRDYGNLRDYGQRVASLIIYLSDVEEGGNTVFPELNVSVRPAAGRVLAFVDAVPNTDVQELRTNHGGEPVTRGTKWIATLWLRQRPMDRPFRRAVQILRYRESLMHPKPKKAKPKKAKPKKATPKKATPRSTTGAAKKGVGPGSQLDFVGRYQEMIKAVYTEKNPAKLKDLDRLFAKYNTESKLKRAYDLICKKYEVADAPAPKAEL